MVIRGKALGYFVFTVILCIGSYNRYGEVVRRAGLIRAGLIFGCLLVMLKVKKKVNQSIEIPDGSKCVDFFEHADGGFGFEEYRRDPEDARGWYPIGNYSNLRLATEREALTEAIIRIPWLKNCIS